MKSGSLALNRRRLSFEVTPIKAINSSHYRYNIRQNIIPLQQTDVKIENVIHNMTLVFLLVNLMKVQSDVEMYIIQFSYHNVEMSSPNMLRLNLHWSRHFLFEPYT